MGKLIELLIALVIFLVIYFGLVPLLGGVFTLWVGRLVIVIAIVYLLTLLSGVVWPWNK